MMMASVVGNGRSGWGALVLLAVLTSAGRLACTPAGGDKAEVEITLDAVLGDFGPEVMLPALTAAVDAATAVEQSLAGVNDPAAAIDPVDALFLKWQIIEVLQVGALGASTTVVAGEDLRESLYSWPTVNPCLVDQITVDGTYVADDFFSTNLPAAMGIDALSYLVHAGPDNACPGQVDINADGAWAAMGPDGVAAARLAYARVLAERVHTELVDLEERWRPEGGNFGEKLRALDTNSPYGSQQEALGAIFDALFYLETSTKDLKIGEPGGLLETNMGEVDPTLAEALPSGQSTEAITANLRSFQLAFQGGSGTGFDDLLATLGHTDLSDRILANTQAAISLTEAESRPIEVLVVEDPAAASAIYTAVKVICDDIKGDLATVLVLQVPSEAAGDND